MKFELSQATSVLARTPEVLRALLGNMPAGWTSGNEGGDSWNPYNVVGHLIDGEESDWIPRARIILAQGTNRRFEPFDRFRHLHRPETTIDDRLALFAELRARSLATLSQLQLTSAQLDLAGEHPDFGPVTLRQLLATWVAHDLGHLAQIARVMAKQYEREVGPWEKYLPVLHR